MQHINASILELVQEIKLEIGENWAPVFADHWIEYMKTRKELSDKLRFKITKCIIEGIGYLASKDSHHCSEKEMVRVAHYCNTDDWEIGLECKECGTYRQIYSSQA